MQYCTLGKNFGRSNAVQKSGWLARGRSATPCLSQAIPAVVPPGACSPMPGASPVVSHVESCPRYAQEMGGLVFGQQSSLASPQGRGRVPTASWLRGGLSGCDMVAGLCPSPHQSYRFLVAAVCLICHRAVGRGESETTRLLLQGNQQAHTLLQRVASHRRGHCELSLVSAMSSLLQQEPGLYEHLVPRIKLKLDGNVAKVS